jgi:hypothetical protein
MELENVTLKKIGTVGVDSGSLIIGDPGYIIFDEEQDKQLGLEWREYCELTTEEETQFNFIQGASGLAVGVNVDDGTYTVHKVLDSDGCVIGYFISQ